MVFTAYWITRVRCALEAALAALHLKDQNRVGIVGGGPAGSFAALHLLQLARQHHLQLEVLIFEPRDFTRAGPSGCNRCAGILSSRLWSNMAELGLSLPEETIQAELQRYTIHLDNDAIQLDRPDPGRRIVSVYRGGGPRLLEGPAVAGFDNYLLQQALSRGATHISSRVRQVTWEGQPVIHTRQESTPLDLLILATGINSKHPLSESFAYNPPRTEVMAQDEVMRPESWPADEVKAYFYQPLGLTFGAIIPKGRFLNISLLGKNFTRDTVDEFITAQNLANALEYNPSGGLCGCNPRIAVSPARHYFGDRWVAVGDAAANRLYKDGIGSAFQTTRAAMTTAVKVGISSHAFRRYYAPTCRSIARDNVYGFLVFKMWNYVLRSPQLLNAWKRTLQLEKTLPVQERVHMRLLWGMLTGDESYRRLFLEGMHPLALRHMGRSFTQRGVGG